MTSLLKFGKDEEKANRSLTRWLKKERIPLPEKEMIFVPVNQEQAHWSLVVIVNPSLAIASSSTSSFSPSKAYSEGDKDSEKEQEKEEGNTKEEKNKTETRGSKMATKEKAYILPLDSLYRNASGPRKSFSFSSSYAKPLKSFLQHVRKSKSIEVRSLFLSFSWRKKRTHSDTSCRI